MPGEEPVGAEGVEVDPQPVMSAAVNKMATKTVSSFFIEILL